ncbi:hypothetical protein FHS76_003493 [Ochrobactrum daejeonense]|uniref:Uncharacterized protein n=1 Tax=Brucella daejeonensis TaxID=659015 RepID=A0A7W9AZR8_9HYPH|nr:hypothetical protein [Brucella daejeonensis]
MTLTSNRYFARCVSDKNPDNPFWYVADGGPQGLNVTVKLQRIIYCDLGISEFYFVLSKEGAEALAELANQKRIDWRAPEWARY